MDAPKLGGIKVFYSHMDRSGFIDSFLDDAPVELALFRIGPTFDCKHIVLSW